MKRNLSRFDHAALNYLRGGHSIETYHIARVCGFDRVNGDRATARARNLLRRLERWGYVEGVRASWYGNVYW